MDSDQAGGVARTSGQIADPTVVFIASRRMLTFCVVLVWGYIRLAARLDHEIVVWQAILR